MQFFFSSHWNCAWEIPVALMEALKFFFIDSIIRWALRFWSGVELCNNFESLSSCSIFNSNFQIDKTVIEKCKNCFRCVTIEKSKTKNNRKNSMPFGFLLLKTSFNDVLYRLAILLHVSPWKFAWQIWTIPTSVASWKLHGSATSIIFLVNLRFILALSWDFPT